MRGVVGRWGGEGRKATSGPSAALKESESSPTSSYLANLYSFIVVNVLFFVACEVSLLVHGMSELSRKGIRQSAFLRRPQMDLSRSRRAPG